MANLIHGFKIEKFRLYIYYKGSGMKANSMKDKKCVFCEYWLGEDTKINYLTGNRDYFSDKGLSKLDMPGGKYKSDNICVDFSAFLLLM